MSAAMNMPGVKIDRTNFLLKTFAPFGINNEALSSKRPSEIYSKDVIEELARNVIKNHTIKVTSISTAAGIPGGLAMLGTVPADLAQFYWHFLVMAQKLAYLYGWPDLRDEDNNLGEGAQAILTIFVGIAFGANGASTVAKEVVEQAARHWAKKLPQMALTKTAWYPIIKKIASYLGIKLTKDGVGKAAGKVIPLLGGIISGTLTYATFKPMANRLHKELKAYSVMFDNDERNT